MNQCYGSKNRVYQLNQVSRTGVVNQVYSLSTNKSNFKKHVSLFKKPGVSSVFLIKHQDGLYAWKPGFLEH